MSFKLRTPGGDLTWLSLAFLGLGLYVLISTGLRPKLIMGVPAAVLAICGVGLWFRQQWARWLAIAAQLFLGGYWAYLFFTQGFKWQNAACLVGSGYFVWILWCRFSPERSTADATEPTEADEASENKKPMISMVLFLREPRYLEAPVLAQIAASAWGGDYSSDEDDDDNHQRYVVGESPLFAVQSPEAFFVVHNVARQYFNDTQAAAKDAKELRLQTAIETHQAWLAVDLISVHDEKAARESVYPQIAKLIAELAGDDCLAIFQPETGKINVWDASLEEKLRGPNPLEDFTEPTHVPVIQVADDDPKMIAAVAEARKRWPEFVAAFKNREGTMYSVKAPITVADKTEFIWIEVDGLEPEYIHGKLGNDPVALGDMKLGDRVEVPVKDLNDWVFLRKEQPVGLFTVKVIQAIQANGD